MHIPFDSLDSTTWLAFADWSTGQGKQKLAKYAGRVGHSLEKFHKAGVDPRMCIGLECGWSSNGVWFRGIRLCSATHQSPLKKTPWQLAYLWWLCPTTDYIDWGTARWIPRENATQEIRVQGEPLVTWPGEFEDRAEGRGYRLSWKFFATLVDRARGLRI